MIPLKLAVRNDGTIRMTTENLRIRDLRARPVMVPMRRVLKTASGEITRAPLVLIDLVTEEGLTGIFYLFIPNPLAMKPLVALLHEMLSLIRGACVAPAAIERHLQSRF